MDYYFGEGESSRPHSPPQIPLNNDPTAALKQASLLSQTLKSKLSPNSEPNLRETRLQVLALRQVNRRLYLTLADHRKHLNGLKTGIDELNAKLTACRFEKHHLFVEAQRCLNVKYESV